MEKIQAKLVASIILGLASIIVTDDSLFNVISNLPYDLDKFFLEDIELIKFSLFDIISLKELIIFWTIYEVYRYVSPKPNRE